MTTATLAAGTDTLYTPPCVYTGSNVPAAQCPSLVTLAPANVMPEVADSDGPFNRSVLAGAEQHPGILGVFRSKETERG